MACSFSIGALGYFAGMVNVIEIWQAKLAGKAKPRCNFIWI
jgi:hypothetical protein